MPTLDPKHLILLSVTSLVLACLFPLLLIAHKLYRYSDKKCFLWLNRLKPLLDSYYAPYQPQSRYWVGLMLLNLRLLDLRFAFFTSSSTNIAGCAVFAMAAGYLVSGKVYDNYYTNLIEASFLVNLVVLAAATVAGKLSIALVETSVGIAFAIMIGIFLYHFHINYMGISILWLKLQRKVSSVKTAILRAVEREDVRKPLLSHNNSCPKVVTQTFVSVREPLLEF